MIDVEDFKRFKAFTRGFRNPPNEFQWGHWHIGFLEALDDDIDADEDADTRDDDNYVYENPDTPTLAIIGRNNTIIIWKNMVREIRSGDEQVFHLSSFHDEKATITACAFSPILFSHRLATADSDGKIAVWDVQTGSLECVTKYHHCDAVNEIAWHPQTGASLTTVSNDGDGRVFDINLSLIHI